MIFFQNVLLYLTHNYITHNYLCKFFLFELNFDYFFVIADMFSLSHSLNFLLLYATIRVCVILASAECLRHRRRAIVSKRLNCEIEI